MHTILMQTNKQINKCKIKNKNKNCDVTPTDMSWTGL